MQISSYQMHNILNDYSRRLEQSKASPRQKSVDAKGPIDKIRISAEGKRQAVVEKVAASIVERITRFGPRDDVDHEIMDQLQGEIDNRPGLSGKPASEFVFNVIDGEKGKTTNTLSGENSKALLERLEELTRAAVDRNMAS
jgi:hypothetical protein